MVYAVTCGEYSDYHIYVIFDNKEMAQLFIDRRASGPYDRFQIEEFEIGKEEDTLPIWKTVWPIDGGDPIGPKIDEYMGKVGVYLGSTWKNQALVKGMVVRCKAENEKLAFKIACDMKAQELARVAGL